MERTGWLRHAHEAVHSRLTVFHKAILAVFAVSLASFAAQRAVGLLPVTAGLRAEEVTLVLVGVLGLSWFLTYGLLRLAFRPVWAVRRTMERIAQGDYRARMPVDRLDPDFAALAESFNRTLDELDRYRRATLFEVQVEEEVRGRGMARTLHDQAGQAITAVIMHLDQVAPQLTDPALIDRTRELRALLAEGLEAIRGLISDLYPQILEDLGLLGALEAYARHQLSDGGFDVDVKVAGALSQVSPKVEVGLYRVAQEAMAAAIHEGGARHVSVRVESSEGGIRMEVLSDSRPARRGDAEIQAHLVSIGDRVKALSGTLLAPPTPQHLVLQVPCGLEAGFDRPA